MTGGLSWEKCLASDEPMVRMQALNQFMVSIESFPSHSTEALALIQRLHTVLISDEVSQIIYLNS
jgi:hypothetical protein